MIRAREVVFRGQGVLVSFIYILSTHVSFLFFFGVWV